MKWALFHNHQNPFTPLATTPLTCSESAAQTKLLRRIKEKWNQHFVAVIDENGVMQTEELFAELTEGEMAHLADEELHNVAFRVFNRIDYSPFEYGVFELELADEGKAIKWKRLLTKKEVLGGMQR